MSRCVADNGPLEPARAMSRMRAGYILLILCVISALNYYDRYLIGILVEDLKRDLILSDSQIGLLSGLAFAVVYSIASLPVAAYADRGHRVRVLGAAVTIWSAMTGLCGIATGFWTLLLARFGVGLGEAGGAPTSHAIVADAFGDRWRATALGTIGIAGALGVTAAYAGGGYVAQHFGWRWAFFGAAIPGLALALLFALTVREPRAPSLVESSGTPPMLTSLGILLRRPAYRWMCIAIAVSTIGGFGSTAWFPAYLMRHFGLDSATVGADYSKITGPASIIAALVSGVLADWLARRDARAPYWFLAVSYLIAVPITVASLTSESYAFVLLLMWPSAFVGFLWVSPTYAIIQALSGPKLRATGAAFFMLCVNLVGQSLGPLSVGALSDHFSASYGDLGLRYALLITTTTQLVGVAGFLFAARTARADMEAAKS